MIRISKILSQEYEYHSCRISISLQYHWRIRWKAGKICNCTYNYKLIRATHSTVYSSTKLGNYHCKVIPEWESEIWQRLQDMNSEWLKNKRQQLKIRLNLWVWPCLILWLLWVCDMSLEPRPRPNIDYIKKLAQLNANMNRLALSNFLMRRSPWIQKTIKFDLYDYSVLSH